MSAAASARFGKLGVAGVGLACAIFATSFWPRAIFAGEVISIEVKMADARIDPRTKQSIIFVKLTEASKRALAEVTQRNVGRDTEFRVDGHVLMKPVIREPLLAGVFEISGNYSLVEAKGIAQRLSSGGRIEVEVFN